MRESLRATTGDESRRVAAIESDPVSAALFSAARAHRTVASELLRESGLYAGQEMLMMRLWEAGEQRQVDLIATLGLDPSTVTRMVQRLEQAGFVSRRPSPTDRRAVLVTATRAGQALRGQVQAAWSALEEVTTAGLDERDRETLVRLLGRAEANLGRAQSTERQPAGAAGP